MSGRRFSDELLAKLAQDLGQLGADIRHIREWQADQKQATEHFRRELTNQIVKIDERLLGVESAVAPWISVRSWGSDVLRQASAKLFLSAAGLLGLALAAWSREVRASAREGIRALWRWLQI